jgi:hypothetical protein
LAAWLTAIFNAFGPIRCSNIKKVLLSPKEMKKAKNVVQVYFFKGSHEKTRRLEKRLTGRQEMTHTGH